MSPAVQAVSREINQYSATLTRLTRLPNSLPEPLLDDWAYFLRQNPKLRIPENEITTLVEALDADGCNNCCRLDKVTSQTVYILLRMSEPCLAYRRGHCLFVVRYGSVPLHTALTLPGIIASLSCQLPGPGEFAGRKKSSFGTDEYLSPITQGFLGPGKEPPGSTMGNLNPDCKSLYHRANLLADWIPRLGTTAWMSREQGNPVKRPGASEVCSPR